MIKQMIFQLILLALFGVIFGSFLNVLIWRLNDEKAPKFWQGRSICPKCKHTLAWQDNIPLFSYLILRGKCRYCRKAISSQYPLVETVTALATILIGFNPLFLILAYAFIVIFFSDVEYQLIPDEMVILISLVAAVLNFQVIGPNLITGLSTALGFFLIVVATKFRGMGLGDVKLAFVMGLLLGFPNILVGVWFSFILGGAFAIGLLMLRRKKIHETMALGPFLVIGTLIAALWSKEILQIIGL